MKKLQKIEILKNVGSSWFALGVQVLVGIFLSPYILHRLGDDAFGLWVLIFSVTGYYGLFDLGIRSSIVRYVAKYAATRDWEGLNRLVGTAMLTYSCVGAVCLLITGVGSLYITALFHVSADFLTTARLLFLMVGTAVALGFPLGVFGGMLEGLQRFYFLNFTSITSTLLRALLIVLALQHGGGLLTVALITVALPILAALLNGAMVLRAVPLRFRLGNMDRGTLRLIANYSGITFVIIVADRLRFKTDAMVIGTFLSSAAITYFSIGSRLVDYATEIVSSLAQIFLPMSTHSEASGDLDGVRTILIAGNRACSLIIFPIAALLIVLGKSVITAWVGARYVAQSYPVLLVLLIPSTLALAQSASPRVLFGMAKHKTLAVVVMLEGLVNLVLSIVLVRKYGILGDAYGTAIPLALTTVFFLPIHLCRLLQIRLAKYLSQTFLLPLTLCAPMVVALLWMRHWFFAHTLLQLAIQSLVGCAVYGIGLAWAISTHRAWRVEEFSPQPTASVPAPVPLMDTFQEEA